MSQSVKPPQVLFVRPKSAGPIRSRPQVSSSLASAVRAKERKPSTSLMPSTSIAAVAPSRPIRPLNNKPSRPSSAIGSRRCFTAASTSASVLALPKTAREPGNPVTCLWQQDFFDQESFREKDGANIYHVVVARKDAEDAAQQLARRIAHFRAQEERVLHEMQNMRTHLEMTLTKTQQQVHQEPISVSTVPLPLHLKGQHTITLDTSTKHTRMPAVSDRRLKVPRSREQLDFIARQKRALTAHKLEAARQQRERQKQALDEQKAKQAEQERKRRCQNERIRVEEQQVLNQRLEKQRQLREEASRQQYERLMAEKQRQHQALGLVAEMQEEEKHLRLRLEALHFHRNYMQQELRGTCSSRGTTGSG